jgi:hypothetical protein
MHQSVSRRPLLLLLMLSDLTTLAHLEGQQLQQLRLVGMF